MTDIELIKIISRKIGLEYEETPEIINRKIGFCVDDNNHVIQLCMNDCNLMNETIPTEVLQLRNLIRLELNGNQIRAVTKRVCELYNGLIN